MSLEREQTLWNDLSEHPDIVAPEITRSYGPRFLLTTHRQFLRPKYRSGPSLVNRPYTIISGDLHHDLWSMENCVNETSHLFRSTT